MEAEQRGAKTNCSGTTDNLLIDRMAYQDSHNVRRNLCIAWVDVRKVVDSVSHERLKEMMSLPKFPHWLCKTVKG